MSADIDFDHHSDEANADPVAYYARFRETCPVGHSAAYDGFHYTTRYADVARIARDDETFSSARSDHGGRGVGIVIPKGPGLEQYPIELDPPRATEYRKLINPLLTPEAVEHLVPMIERHAARVVDDFIELGSCDFVRDLTNPLPAAVTLDWLGFPEEDWAKLAGPIHDIFAAPAGSERAVRGAAGLAYMDQRIRELIAERRSEPKPDGVSTLVAGRRADGSEFGDDELVSVIGLLIAGGVDTTTSLTGSTLVHLARHPDQRQKLIDSPDLLDTATEEFLRAFAPSQSMARTVTQDVEVGGCPMRAGDRVLIPWVAANHDPAVFPDPDQVRLDRDAGRHLSFGIGSHRCAGAHLARAMFRAMMTQVLTRLPDYRVIEEGLIPYPTRGNQSGWDAVPAVFTSGPRATAAAGSSRALTTPTPLRVTEVRAAADGVVAVGLALPDGGELPAWQPGAHVELRLPSGRLRQYSLCGDPADAATWRIGVLHEPEGRGGSVELHGLARPGATFAVRGPRNHFPLTPAPSYLFLAGGIGITPILAMVREAAGRGTPFTVVYGGRTRSTMGFADELAAVAGDALTLLPQDEAGLPDLPRLLGGLDADTAVYACGPSPMLAAVERECARLDLTDRLHLERFAAGDDLETAFDAAENRTFEVRLARTGVTLPVPADRRLIEVLRDAVSGLSYDCEKGYCGACETRVLAGTPEHRDSVLSDEERLAGRTMMICVGRCQGDRLVLDL
ncbi:cytochrome P450 [Streptomyces europaeiscabiei]|uniref:cytochrome P450/oxidoreductase n=2 Tax=Streptomyces TaxID=1883 RepID=UPI0029B29530|nr:cytochrome P450 [Streptomyces europaeiscabiei]MDX3580648.1 cytochrome P450 [Streptomyces europaeiscabiei]MDX3611632.1 cytochrome P450 [Streptomyces europaeiscabiei]MDX3630760.1 cytochrome P450 [Streptomyces europaeiscabiei]MDX3649226.1 cytochrome P450 [Streptomyces europaeiscabiei]WUD37254.1 cytochrome P450 [Streptomyces europaeiscabiei]